MAKKRRKSRKGKVTRYSRCVGKELRGRKFGNRTAARAAMRRAAKKCKKK